MSNSQQNIRVYTPESSINKPGRMIIEIFQGFREGQFLGWRLYIRNLKSQYRQSLLGLFWAIFPPLVSGLVWIFLQNQKVFDVGPTPVPYPVFVLTGTILWQVFLDSVNVPMGVIISSKQMMTKINFPKEALVLTGLYQILGNLIIKLVLLGAVYFWFEVNPGISLIKSLFGISMLISFGIGVSLCLTPLAMLYGDVKRILTITLQFLFFLTPIIYPKPTEGIAKVIAEINPIAHIIITTRDWLTIGTSSQTHSFLVISVIGIILLFTGILLLKVAIPLIVERIGS